MSSGNPACGSQLCCRASVDASDWSMPMPIPAATVGSNKSNPPTTAAARAGTTASV